MPAVLPVAGMELVAVALGRRRLARWVRRRACLIGDLPYSLASVESRHHFAEEEALGDRAEIARIEAVVAVIADEEVLACGQLGWRMIAACVPPGSEGDSMAILVFDDGSYGMRFGNPGKTGRVERLHGKGPAVD